jgi:hypothetical protein
MKNTNDILKKVMTLLSMEVKMAEMKLENGTILVSDNFEVGTEVFIYTAEDDTKVPVPVGEYKLEDGSVLVVEQEGIIAGMKKEVEGEEGVSIEVEAAEEEIIETPVPAEVAPAMEEVVSAVVEAIAPIIEEVKAEMAKLREEMGKKKEEMSKTPAAPLKKHAPVENRDQPIKLKTMNTQSTSSRVMNRLFGNQ